MKKSGIPGWILTQFMVFFLFAGPFINAQEFTSPDDFFGFRPGTDRQLFDYEQLIEYLKKLDAESPMVKLEEIGKSPMGKPMYLLFLSDPANIANLENLKKINHQLALNPDLSEAERSRLSKEGRVFVVATLSMHSTEVGPSQSVPLIAYNLVTAKDPSVSEKLKDVVYMMVPNHNPDGMDFVVNNYKKYRGTGYEGASLPRVYHKYVGHDNNRDFVILSQEDTRAISRIFTHTWLPQVMVEKHQMGSTGVRYFVPPSHDPIAQNIDAGMWTWVGIFGQNMMNDMTNAGLEGVTQRYIFDLYWPGSTETCLWNNVISFLTEAASAREATPIYVEPNELSAGGKGLADYKKSNSMPLPWKGGWWHLSDIVKYEIASTKSIIKTASLYKERILLFRNDMCKREVKKGQTEAPCYYIIPRKQYDKGEMIDLINLLKDHGINVYTMTKDMLVDGKPFQEGDFVVPLAQPYRALIKEILEKQEYPVRHFRPGGEVMRPYDITTWSLPLHRQVSSFEITERDPNLETAINLHEGMLTMKAARPESFIAAIYPVNYNQSFKAAFIAMNKDMTVRRLTADVQSGGHLLRKGSFIVENSKRTAAGWDEIEKNLVFSPVYLTEGPLPEAAPVSIPKIALVETYYHDMDAGWTRYVLDTYRIPFTVVRPHELKESDLVNGFDVIVFPDNSKSRLMTGGYGSEGAYNMSSYAPEYVKGMEKQGLENLMAFMNDGGIILSWGGSTAIFQGKLTIDNGSSKENFQLPFRDQSANLRNRGLYVAGALLKVQLIRDHPLTLGLPGEISVFSRGRPVFATSVPRFDMDRRVIASFPEKDILMSGYAENPELLGRTSAVVWLKKGKGQLVVYGFSPMFRASTQASYKLFFNGLFQGMD